MPGDRTLRTRGASRPDGVAAPAMTVVARQAIYDAQLDLRAYELLFRTIDDSSGFPLGAEADTATIEVLVTAFTEIGMDDLVGEHLAFVNIPYRFLVDGFCSALPRERVVLEILEDVVLDDRVLAAVQGLAADGYQIALDDFVFRPGLEPLLEVAQVIKVDVLALRGDDLRYTLDRIRPYGARLLAEKVEDPRSLPQLRQLGFEYFQGYGLERPTVIHGTRSEANRTVVVELLAELHRPEVEISALLEVLPRDPSLVYALLRVVNSASLSRGVPISSLHQALVRLGIHGVRNWATMILLTRVSGGRPALLSQALVRAKMSEKLGSEAGATAAGAFTVGLLSALPEMLGEPLEELVGRLSLDPDVERALLHREGPYGLVLSWVLAYEEGDDRALMELGAPAVLPSAFLASVAWARSLEDHLS